MTTGQDRLIKEIDTLTYNARTIINALNRSVMAGSSSSGFTVTRSGFELTLTRPLIYRLFKFYEEWANNQFFTGTESPGSYLNFDSILEKHDLVPVKDDQGDIILATPATTALVLHSKILFFPDLTTENNENTSENRDFWIGKLKTAPNPKLITNSAPIPLNIRTPLFDENLSTTKYLSHESYLFPYAYFALDFLGYSGDKVHHQLGGESWEIIADEFIRLRSNDIAVGGANPDAIYKKEEDRTHQIDGESNYSFVWGYDTHARGDFSTAGGVSSMAIGNHSTAIGKRNLALGEDSIVFGFENVAVGEKSSVLGGEGNTSFGAKSTVLGGSDNVTGEDVFAFDVFNLTTITVPGDITDSVQANDFLTFFDFKSDGNSFYDTLGKGIKEVTIQVLAVFYDGGEGVTDIGLSAVLPSGIDSGSFSRSFRSSDSSVPGTGSVVSGLGNRASGAYQSVFGKWNKKDVPAHVLVGGGTSNLSRDNIVAVRDQEFFLAAGGGFDYSLGIGSSFYGVHSNKTTGQTLLRAANSYLVLTDTQSFLASAGDFGITSVAGHMEFAWATSLKLAGDTFGALPTTDKQRNHVIASSQPAGRTSLLNLVTSGFFTVTGDGSADLLLPTNIGVGTDNKAFLLNLVHSDNLTAPYSTAQDFRSLQILYGTHPSNDGDASARIGIRKIEGVAGVGSPQPWKYLAQMDDIDAINTTIGVWGYSENISEKIAEILLAESGLDSRVTTIEDVTIPAIDGRVTTLESWGFWESTQIPTFTSFDGSAPGGVPSGSVTLTQWHAVYSKVNKLVTYTFYGTVTLAGTVKTLRWTVDPAFIIKLFLLDGATIIGMRGAGQYGNTPGSAIFQAIGKNGVDGNYFELVTLATGSGFPAGSGSISGSITFEIE